VPPSECLFWDGGSEFRCEDSLYDFVTLCVCENDINEAQPPVMWGTGNMQSGYVKECFTQVTLQRNCSKSGDAFAKIRKANMLLWHAYLSLWPEDSGALTSMLFTRPIFIL
jgi:hypothetical protein